MKNQATVRSQFLDYNLIRSGRFNANELALLNVIVTFSDRCEMNQTYLAKAINKSIPTIRRTIKSLLQKGIITRTYTLFKRCLIRVVSLDEQKKLLSMTGMIKQALKIAKNKTKNVIKSSYRSSVNVLNRSSVIEPTRNETKEKKQIKIDTFLEQKLDLKPKTFDLNKAKEEAIAKFKAAYLQ